MESDKITPEIAGHIRAKYASLADIGYTRKCSLAMLASDLKNIYGIDISERYIGEYTHRDYDEAKREERERIKDRRRKRVEKLRNRNPQYVGILETAEKFERGEPFEPLGSENSYVNVLLALRKHDDCILTTKLSAKIRNCKISRELRVLKMLGFTEKATKEKRMISKKGIDYLSASKL